MKIKEGFVLRDVCGESVICGEGLKTIDFGRLITLNETATWLWQEAARQCDFTIESLTTAMCEEYEITEDQARKDIESLIGNWQNLKMIAD